MNTALFYTKLLLSALFLIACNGCALTGENAKLIENYKRPNTEFIPAVDGTVLRANLSETRNNYQLLIADVMKGPHLLELTFPKYPTTPNIEFSSIEIVGSNNYNWSSNRIVEVNLVGHNVHRETNTLNELTSFQGSPTRFVLEVGLYGGPTLNDNVSFTLGYRYTSSDLAIASSYYHMGWMNRSYPVIAGYHMRYLYTVPLDILISPFVLLDTCLTSCLVPSWP